MTGIPQRRLFRSATGVAVILNETAENTIKESQPNFQTHDGETRKSMLPEDFENMDKI